MVTNGLSRLGGRTGFLPSLRIGSFEKLTGSLKSKLVTAFLLVALVPLAIVGTLGYVSARGALNAEAENKLTALREAKADQIDRYFGTIAGQMTTLSQDVGTLHAVQDFKDAFRLLPSQIETDLTAIRGYYNNEFLPRFEEGSGTAATVAGYLPSDELALAAQSVFIATNPNPTGSKNSLVDPENGTTYGQAHATYHPMFNSFLNEFGYYDIFLVDPETGHIVYSVFKEIDFGTSLFTGPYAETGIADAFRGALALESGDESFLTDFATYDPSYTAPASFIGSQIVENGEVVGILVFQMPVDRINDIMQATAGMGESGETYLVGSDLLMRSNSRFSEESTILGLEIDTLGAHEALAGQSGIRVIDDYRGIPVLSAYAPLVVGGHQWAILAEIDQAEVGAPVQRLLYTTLVVIVLAVAAIVAAGYMVAKQISRPVVEMSANLRALASDTMPKLVGVTKQVADGNLTARTSVSVQELDESARDEVGVMARAYNALGVQVEQVGGAINAMVHALGKVIGNVRQSAGNVAGASTQLSTAAEQAGAATQEIATVAQQISSDSHEQAATVQEVHALVQRMTASIDGISRGSSDQTDSVTTAHRIVTEVSNAVEGVATNAQSAADGARLASLAAEGGMEVVQRTAENMETIKAAVASVATRVSELGAKSEEIGKIVSVIDDIASQTDLLALNATIEAARAGEHGHGFAVVAEEVRKLAERVTYATSEIAGLIEGVQAGVDHSMQATKEGTKQVEEGAGLSEEAGNALSNIIESVASVSGQVEEIAAAAQQVSAGASSMIATIDDVAEVATRNEGAASEVGGAANDVAHTVESVNTATERSSSAAEHASAATEQMSAQVEEFVAAAPELTTVAGRLMDSVSAFELDPNQLAEGSGDAEESGNNESGE